MSEPFAPPRQAAPTTEPMDSAGSLLRKAREAQGLHLAALATMLKIPPKKLEALEADRYEELQGVTFTRALAQSACRVLKMDPAPVLARLPRAEPGSLGPAGRGLNEPFRERALRRDPLELLRAGKGVLALVAVLLMAAAALWLAPPGFGLAHLSSLNLPFFGAASAPSGEEVVAAVGNETVQPDGTLNTAALPPSDGPGAASGAVSSAAAPGTTALPASVPVPRNGLDLGGDALVPAAPPVQPLQLVAREASWIEVLDAKGEALLARTLAPGEAVGLDGVLPVRVKIGNAAGTELSFRGQAVDLAPVTRDNVARLELK